MAKNALKLQKPPDLSSFFLLFCIIYPLRQIFFCKNTKFNRSAVLQQQFAPTFQNAGRSFGFVVQQRKICCTTVGHELPSKIEREDRKMKKNNLRFDFFRVEKAIIQPKRPRISAVFLFL